MAAQPPEPDSHLKSVQDSLEKWAKIADTVAVDGPSSDTPKVIEDVFRAWGGLAQRQLPSDVKADQRLYWSVFQLRLQAQLLDTLFTILIYFPLRPASITHGLVKGIVMSAFGSVQANREIWQGNETADMQSRRIRDLTLLIALESLCLSQITSRVVEDSEPEDVLGQSSKTILESKDDLFAINGFLLDQSSNLAPTSNEKAYDPTRIPSWPLPVLCLGWAIVMNSLPDKMRFPTPGLPPMHQEFGIRGLRLQSGLFVWLEEVLTGPLFLREAEEDEEIGLQSEVSRRKVVKDLLIGLADLVHVDNIADKDGMIKVYELLFGHGSPEAVARLCEDYWTFDASINTRRAILFPGSFPRQTILPAMLSALSGIGSSEPHSQSDFEVGPVLSVFRYFSSLERLALPVASVGDYLTTGVDSLGRVEIATTSKIVLPGGEVIGAGTKGTLLNSNSDLIKYVELETSVSGWSLLFEILRSAAGLRGRDQHTSSLRRGADFIHLSIADLGIQVDSTAILSSGLRLFRSVLHPTFAISHAVVESLSTGVEDPAVAILEVVLATLDRMRGVDLSIEQAHIAKLAVSIIGSLVSLPGSNVPLVLRNSSFFGALGKRKSIAADLIHQEVSRGEHDLTLSILRLVTSIVQSVSGSTRSDSGIARSALHLVFDNVWSQVTGWRFKDVAKRYQIISLLASAFTTVLSHPLGHDGKHPSQAAAYLIDAFISSASLMTYRPISDVLAQGTSLAEKLLEQERRADAALVVDSLEATLGLLKTLLRVSAAIQTPSTALPKSFLGTPIVGAKGERTQLVDSLFDLAVYPSLPATTRVAVLQLLRAYLETTASDTQRPSLAALLKDANKSCSAFEEIANKGENTEIKALTWNLLGSIIATQPGCASACIGSSDKELSGPLAKAVERVSTYDEIISSSPRILSAALGYCVAVLQSPSSTDAVKALRSHPDFWTAVHELSTRTVPSPPTFTLSMHADDFSSRIQAYAYAVQAKANATSLLAAELSLLADGDEDEDTKVRDLVLGLFKKGSSLTEAAGGAMHSSCYPELHEEQERRLQAAHVDLNALKTIALPTEREYGRMYLYDGDPIIPEDQVQQATVNLALDLLNLNWSMMDADITLTKAFRELAEEALVWTDDDPMTAEPALKAAVAVSELLADEERGGDIMLSIQAERLSILVILLQMACAEDASNDPDQLAQVCTNTRRILENPLFPPMLGLRHPELPALHRPILRVLVLVLQALSRSNPAPALNIDSTIEVATSFTLEAADAVLDGLIRQPDHPPSLAADLSSIVGVLCEVVTSPNAEVWLDLIAGSSLISRGLEIITRSRIVKGHVAPQVASVLLLHLALASHPSYAEKLALSGILPSYSHNCIAVEAEQGRITPQSPSPTPDSVHGIWCGILLVVKALLSSLPPTHVANFARTEVIPFIRVCTPQLIKALRWNGEAQLSRPDLDELELVTDVFYGIAAAVGPNEGLLDDLMDPFLLLLKSIRFALSHPRLLSTLFVPSTEEERTALEEEYAGLDKESDVVLLDFKKAPIIASRTASVMGIARSAVMTLVTLTRAWDVIRGDDDMPLAGVLEAEDEPRSTTDDPVGILNDLHLYASTTLTRLPATSTDAPRLASRKIVAQLSESTAVLSTSQIFSRLALLPQDAQGGDDSMDLDSKPSKGRLSIGGVVSAMTDRSAEKAGVVLRELAGDLRGMLPGDDGDRLLVRLRRDLEDVYGMD